MKSKIVLNVHWVMAVIAFAVMFGPTLLLLVPVVPLATYFIRRDKTLQPENLGQKIYASINEAERAYGEPEDVAVLNVTKGNELSSLILFYPSKNVMIVCGEEFHLSDVTSVAAKNQGIPYAPDDYVVILSTRIPGRTTVRIPVGNTTVGSYGLQAQEIAEQIARYL